MALSALVGWLRLSKGLGSLVRFAARTKRHTTCTALSKSPNSQPHPAQPTDTQNTNIRAQTARGSPPGGCVASDAGGACAAGMACVRPQPTPNFAGTLLAAHPAFFNAVKPTTLPPFLRVRQWQCEAQNRRGLRAKWSNVPTCLPTLRPPCAHTAHMQPPALAVRTLSKDLCCAAKRGRPRLRGWAAASMATFECLTTAQLTRPQPLPLAAAAAVAAAAQISVNLCST
jgi:hypothetical protein